MAGAILFDMKSARAKVVKGTIVTRAKFPEGARLTILMDDDGPPVDLSPDDEAAMIKGLASIKAGKGISLEAFRARRRRSTR